MAINVNLAQLSTLNNTSILSQNNQNFSTIQTALPDALSRSGQTPNQMNSVLDMNSYPIINLPPPGSANSPARLVDVTSTNPISISLSLTGDVTAPASSGVLTTTLAAKAFNNTWTGLNTFSTGSSLGPAISVSMSPTGTSASNVEFNHFSITENTNLGSNTGYGLAVNLNVDGSSVQGGRSAISGIMNLQATTSASNPNRNYVGAQGIATASVPDNGTLSGPFNPQGAVFGMNGFAILNTGATGYLNVTGCEFDVGIQTGASAYTKSGIQISGDTTDRVQGSAVDAMIWMYNQSPSNPGWNFGIFMDNGAGAGTNVFGVATTGTLFRAQNATVQNGIDFGTMTFNGDAFISNGFVVNGLGSVLVGKVGGSPGSGVIQINGTTSGNVQVSTNSTGTQLNVTQPIIIGTTGGGGGNGGVTLAGTSSGTSSFTVNSTGVLSILGGGSAPIQFTGPGSFTANGAVATAMSSVGPTGSHTSVQTWLTIVDGGGNTRYIPCF